MSVRRGRDGYDTATNKQCQNCRINKTNNCNRGNPCDECNIRGKPCVYPIHLHSCTSCRQNQWSCDRAFPVCGQCAKLGLRCHRSDTPSTATPSSINDDEPAAKRPNLDAVDVVAPKKTCHESDAPFIVIPFITDDDEPAAKRLRPDAVDTMAPKATCHKSDAPSSAAPPIIDDNEPAAKRRKLDAVASKETLIVKLPVVLPPPSSSSGAVRKLQELWTQPYKVWSDWSPAAETGVQDSTDNADLPDNPLDLGSRTETAVLILGALQNSRDSETTGVRYGDLVRQISEGTEEAVDGAEFAHAVGYLERSSVVQVIGEGARRRIALLDNEIVTGVSSESTTSDQDTSWTLLAQDDEAETTAAQIFRSSKQGRRREQPCISNRPISETRGSHLCCCR
jgi:hypothetical protein